jgi:hypothetical protein
LFDSTRLDELNPHLKFKLNHDGKSRQEKILILVLSIPGINAGAFRTIPVNCSRYAGKYPGFQ